VSTISRRAVVIALTTLPVLAPNAAAQTPVAWTTRSAKVRAAPGAVVPVTISATIASGWHIYSLTQGQGGPFPMRITVPAGQPFTLGGDVEGPVPRVELDPNFGIEVEMYSEAAEFTVPLRIARSADSRTYTARIAARFQACNARLCLPPRTVTLEVPIVVARTGPR